MLAKTKPFAAALVAVIVSTGAPVVTSSSAEAAQCGGLNERPCAALSGRPFCQKGLLHIPFKKCVRPPKIAAPKFRPPKIKPPKIELPNPVGGGGDLKTKAKKTLRDAEHVVRILVSMQRCVNGRHEDALHLARLLKSKQRFDIKRLPAYRNCISRPLADLRALGYKSIQIGDAGNAGVGLDGSHEQGIALSTSGRGRAYHYQTWGYGLGWTAGASVNISVTANLARPDRVGARMPKGALGHGFVVAGYGTYGGGVGLWFDYENRQISSERLWRCRS